MAGCTTRTATGGMPVGDDRSLQLIDEPREDGADGVGDRGDILRRLPRDLDVDDDGVELCSTL